jgi:hypothetical protein
MLSCYKGSTLLTHNFSDDEKQFYEIGPAFHRRDTRRILDQANQFGSDLWKESFFLLILPYR